MATGSVIGKRFRRHRTSEFLKSIKLIDEQVEPELDTEKQLGRGNHHSVREIERAIQEFLDAHKESPIPFRWVKTANDIFAKVARYCTDTVNLRVSRLMFRINATPH